MAPNEWELVSNENGKISGDNKDFENLLKFISKDQLKDMKVMKFDQSKKISTYLYALVAGPYTFVESNKPGLPPMKIYMRKSVMPEVKPETLEEMFMTT